MKVEQDNSVADLPKGVNELSEVIFVIDDDASVREGLAELIGSLGFNVKTYSSANEFLTKEPKKLCGCIILDVFMPGMTGLDLQQRLNSDDLYLPIIFLTGRGDIPMTVHALKNGAAHFLTKPVQEKELILALREALDAGRALRQQNAELSEIRERIRTLAPRELEVMALVVSGKLNKQIAHELGITERTVKLYRGRVMQKMTVKSLAELVQQAEKTGLRDLGAKKQRAPGEHKRFSIRDSAC